jgi:hypothetical protein
MKSQGIGTAGEGMPSCHGLGTESSSLLDKTGPISVMHLWIKEIEESRRNDY